MLYSPGKEYDVQQRDKCLKNMEECVQRYAFTKSEIWLTNAKSWGLLSNYYKKRIHSHNYKILDRIYRSLWN